MTIGCDDGTVDDGADVGLAYRSASSRESLMADDSSGSSSESVSDIVPYQDIITYQIDHSEHRAFDVSKLTM